ncbi:MAG: membrane dipeptidase [Calditrichaeota bacterium]|nr:membrane dipeptidase [Calditrichota bacterium]
MQKKDPEDVQLRIAEIHKKNVFADIHAHPSRFHRANIPRISQEEISRYQRGYMDVVVCNVSSDAPYSGGYVKRDGVEISRMPRGEFKTLQPGEAFAFASDRLSRVIKTIEDGDAVLADNPSVVLNARKKMKVALLPALEGADGLEGKIENLRKLHRRGLRLLQLVHFRVNELGHIQTFPYTPGGLTEFGREVVVECNRLGIIIDLAHANTQTIMETLELSEHPVIFSHTGVKALHDGDRYLRDDEILAIAKKGGVIGIWPNGSSSPRMADMVRHIDYVKKLAGVNHVGIGSDLRGMGSYTKEFGDKANFQAIALALLELGYTDDQVGMIMGGNFFRVWQQVTAN